MVRINHTPSEAEWAAEIVEYEGLVRCTAARYVAFVEEDFEDICQIFRVKVWKALCSFDASKTNLSVQRYVFQCLKNQAKDLLKRARRNWLYIEDMKSPEGWEHNHFEYRYLQQTAESVFGRIDEGVLLVPSTLTETERQVVALLYLDYTQKEALLMLGMGKHETEKVVRTIREKMEDWRPSSETTAVVPIERIEPPAVERQAA